MAMHLNGGTPSQMVGQAQMLLAKVPIDGTEGHVPEQCHRVALHPRAWEYHGACDQCDS